MKQRLGSKPMLYPYPTVLLGTVVEGRVNFATIGFCGIVNANPAMIAVGVNRNHFSTAGIKDNRQFSINVVSEDMMVKADWAGMNSGKKVDKSKLFEVFYGQLANAPLIEEAPINMECELLEMHDIGGFDNIYIAKIVDVHCEEQYLINGTPDISKVKPLLMSMFDNRYWAVGEQLGKAWSVGKDFKAE